MQIDEYDQEVWIVIRKEAGESDKILKVFDSQESALAYIKKQAKNLPKSDRGFINFNAIKRKVNK